VTFEDQFSIELVLCLLGDGRVLFIPSCLLLEHGANLVQ